MDSYRLPDGSVPVLLSADNTDLLREEAVGILSYVADHPAVSVDEVAAMLFRTRAARRHRALVLGVDRDGLLDALRALLDGHAHPALVLGRADAVRRHAFVFPGQGGQRPGMGRLYYERSAAYRAEVDRCAALFAELFGERGTAPVEYLLADPETSGGTAASGAATRIVQPALFLQMAGLAAMWRAAGVEPVGVVGHSQGEIAAAYVAGKMSLADALVVVGARAEAVDRIASDAYAMALVEADRDECEALLAPHPGWSAVSVINSPRLVGISGERATVAEVVAELAAIGRFSRVIKVGYPAHTHKVDELRGEFGATLRRHHVAAAFLDSEIDCIGATLGTPVTADRPLHDYWFLNLRNIVRFDRAVAAAVEHDLDSFVELAAHPTLHLPLRENLAATPAATVSATSNRTAVDLAPFTRNLAELAVADSGYRWSALRVAAAHPGLPLLDFPAMRMSRQRLWLESGRDSVRAVTPRATAPASARPQLLVESWTRTTRSALTAPRSIGLADPFGECAELVGQLCAAAADLDATARPVDSDAGGDNGDIDTVAVLLPDLSDRDAAAAVTQFFAERSWWSKPGRRVAECWLVTVGAEAVFDGDLPDPAAAAIGAGFRSIGAEHPGIAFRHLDLPAAPTPDAAQSILVALHTTGEAELAVRAGYRYAKRLTTGVVGAGLVPARQNIVITGGTGKLGLEFCDHFARSGARRITLVSRTGATPAVAERLAGVRGADVRVWACDIGDPAAVRALADEFRDAPPDLIIHAAADHAGVESADLAEITSAHVGGALRAKIAGLEHVLELLPLTDDGRVVLCSSLAATLGGRGTIVYAAANRMLDALAHRARAAGTECVSVQWGQWAVHRGAGAADVSTLAEVGYLPMDSADAIALGLGGLDANAIVAAFDWDRGRSVFGAFGHGSLLSELSAPAPAAVERSAPVGSAVVAAVEPRTRIVELVARALGEDDVDVIDRTRSLVALGLDSLQALEFRRRVQAEFGVELPVAELISGASIDDVIRMLGHTPAQSPPRAAPDLADRARRAAEQIVPADLDVDRFRSARADMDGFGLAAMLRVVEPALHDPAADHTTAQSVAAIADRLGFAPRHRWLLRQWLEALTTHGCLTGDPDLGYRPAGAPPPTIRGGLAEVCADLGYAPELATFLTASDDHLADLARDRMRVQELLFPGGDMLVAESAYRSNLISRYLNRAAREIVAGLVDRLRERRTPVRILELGAGIGGTTDDVVAGLDGLPVEYHFTDVSDFFLDAARVRFADRSWMRFSLVDMNTDLRGQPRYDVVIASNVLHNAGHIGHTLNELHDLLEPGGAVVIIETCWAHCELLTSVHFLMSPPDGRPLAGATDVRAGTDRIFLTEDEWREQLSAAGLRPIAVLPDTDHPLALLDQRVFAAVRDGGAE
ncbi:nocobactin polyketide synthase NbtC [Nocardia sp. NPDC055321]